jgi:hypothetical protein
MTFLVLVVINASCSGNDGSAQGYSSRSPQSDSTVATRSAAVPIISARSYLGGSTKVTVTGSFQIGEDIPINTQASYGDGEMTWLQYGASGAEAPNALVTVSAEEVGVNAGRGKLAAGRWET